MSAEGITVHEANLEEDEETFSGYACNFLILSMLTYAVSPGFYACAGSWKTPTTMLFVTVRIIK